MRGRRRSLESPHDSAIRAPEPQSENPYLEIFYLLLETHRPLARGEKSGLVQTLAGLGHDLVENILCELVDERMPQAPQIVG